MSEQPTPATYANVATKTCRLITAFQRRPLSDALFQWIWPTRLRAPGDFTFAICAKTTNRAEVEGEISGTIFILLPFATKRTLTETKVQTVIDAINEARLETGDWRSHEVHAQFDDGNETLVSKSDVCIEFFLCRNGEVFFGVPTYRDKQLQDSSEAFAKREGHDFAKFLSNQAYFFLRDISHRHQHHDAKSDMIITLRDRNDGALRWRTNIIYALHYYIVRLKRRGGKFEIAKAMGVLSYCNSYVSIAKRALGEEQSALLPVYNDDAILASLEASQRVAIMRHDDRVAANSDIIAKAGLQRASSIGLLTMLSGLVGVVIGLAIEHKENATLSALSSLVETHIQALLWIMVFWMISIVVPVSWRRWVLSGWHLGSEFGRDLFEVANWNLKGARAASILLLLMGAIGTIYYGLPALVNIGSFFGAIPHLFNAGN